LRTPTLTFDSVSSVTSRTFLPLMPPWPMSSLSWWARVATGQMPAAAAAAA
jgi:hypothetical protein